MDQVLHVVCTHCNAVNRISPSRLRDHPKCGKCHASLFTGQPVEVNAIQFDLLLSRSSLPLLVDFWAPWCGPCLSMAPAYKQAAAALEPDYHVIKVNVDDEPTLAARYRIQSIPTIAIFRNGQEVTRQAGAMSSQSMLSWARSMTTSNA